jgi:5-hydroxyisourate hydrolase
MAGITTHVLDTARGGPAPGIAITLEIEADGSWQRIGAGHTDADGRLATLMGEHALHAATYRISFATGPYFGARGEACFYPRVQIEFRISAPDQHYHVPILLSPFGYTTYRGS